LEKGEYCHGLIPLLPFLYNTKLATLFNAPLDEEFGTVKRNIEQFWHNVWPHVCNKINNFLTPTSCVKPLRPRYRNQCLNPSYATLLAIIILLTFVVSSCILNFNHTIAAKNHGFEISKPLR
jgi:hypothetical protein